MATTTRKNSWWRQPLLWLWFGLVAAALAASIWTIVVAGRQADTPLEGVKTTPGIGVAQHAPPPAPQQ